MEYLGSTMKALVFDVLIDGNGLAPTTNMYCYFNATLMCSILDKMLFPMSEIKYKQ